MTEIPTCAHCGREMPAGAVFGPTDWTPWQPGDEATFTQFCPDCREHNPMGTASPKQSRLTWETMMRIAARGGAR